MASATVNCSPKTFSPRVLIHRTDYNGLTNMYKRGTPGMVLSRKSVTALPLRVGLDTGSVTETEPVNFELRNSESSRKKTTRDKMKTDREALKMKRDCHANASDLIDQELAVGSNMWNEAGRVSQLNPAMKHICSCCKCCYSDFREVCLQQPKDACDFKKILPHIFKINSEYFNDSPKSDSLRRTLFNSSIRNKDLLNLSCTGSASCSGAIWSNRCLYPGIETYAHHLFKEEFLNSCNESAKSVTSVADSVASSISYHLPKTFPMTIGNACYKACDGNNAKHVFWPLLSQNSKSLPVPSCATSLSFTIPPSSASFPPPSANSAPSSLSSVCLFRRESFFTYDPKPPLFDGLGSYCLQAKLKRDPSESDVCTSPNKRFKYSEAKIKAEHYQSDVPFVNSVTVTHGTKYNGAGTAKTTSTYKVPNESVNEKQIQKTKNFHCPFCNISCSNRGQLQGHVRIHTGKFMEIII